MLKDRKSEVESLDLLCITIKQWIKKNKSQLLTKHKEEMPAVIAMQKQVSDLRR